MTDKEKFEKIIIKLTKGDGTLEDLKNASTFEVYSDIPLRINTLKKQYKVKSVSKNGDVVLIDPTCMNTWQVNKLISNFRNNGEVYIPWLAMFEVYTPWLAMFNESKPHHYNINTPFINTNIIPTSTSEEIITEESYNKLKSMISSTDKDTVRLAYKLISEKYSFELNQEKITLLYLCSNNTFYPSLRTTKEIKNTIKRIKNLYPNFR
jgi:hypothetical protein